jgi:adenylate cyclase
MFFRLPTVRSKLTALVLLSTVVMVAALPVLSWLLHRQLVDEVDDRVTDAERSFQSELDDDIADLTLASRVLAADSATVHALERHDANRARRLAQVFVDVYPDIDVLLFEPDGSVLAHVGCEQPPEQMTPGSEIAALFASGAHSEAVVSHGCESETSGAPPAYAIAVSMGTSGSLVVCQPLDANYLGNSKSKLGLELAFAAVDPGSGSPLAGRTRDFPQPAIAVSSRGSTLVDVGDRSWAVARFEPRQLGGRAGRMQIVAALDITDIHRIVRRNLLAALGVLAAAATISVVFGSRLAGTMSRALQRVNAALSRVEQADYVHVEPVRTGDELETLARGFNRMVDGLKERDKLRTTFGKYMTASVMEHLLAGKVALGGESLQVTILFTDIRSFTTIGERMDPQQLVALLNEYFTEMVSIVMQEDGVVDKYIGDAIMAVFGAPVPRSDDAVHAVRAAVRMRRALEQLNRRLEARGVPSLRTGIGIHTGEVEGHRGEGDAAHHGQRSNASRHDLRTDRPQRRRRRATGLRLMPGPPSTDASVLVPMVQVRGVRMGVRHGLVPVDVRMRDGARTVVGVSVMSVVVSVKVLVLDGAVRVRVLVVLREVKREAQRERRRGHQCPRASRGLAQREREQGAEKRGHREDRACARHPDAALGT